MADAQVTASASRSPLLLALEVHYLLVNHSQGEDSVTLQFPRIGLGLGYPLWRLPVRGHSSLGVEWAKLFFRDHRNWGDVEVEAVSDPTLYFRQALELHILGGEGVNLFLFARGGLSLFPKTFDDYHVGLSNGEQTWNLTELSRRHIQEVSYDLLDVDAGLGFQYRNWKHLKPYGRVGFSRLDATVTMDYRESGRQLMKSARISHSALERGRFDFSENFLNAAVGTHIPVGRLFVIDFEGRLIPLEDSVVTSFITSLQFLLEPGK